jgi:cytochrome c oxidase subunit 2
MTYFFAENFSMWSNIITKLNGLFFSKKLEINDITGFPMPANEAMSNVIFLYSEIMLVGIVVSALILFVMATIFDKYVYNRNRYAFNFTTEMESFLDVFFILFPTLIIILILMPALGYLYIAEEFQNNSDFAFSLFVTGHQWYWTYSYELPDINVYFWQTDAADIATLFKANTNEVIYKEFDSILVDSAVDRLLSVDNILILPINTQIAAFISSEDVIHSWALPQFNIKVDAIPGRTAMVVFNVVSLNFWYGQCSELCGELHGFMPIVIQSVQPKTFFTYMLEPFASYEEQPSLENYLAEYANSNGPAITKASKFVEENYYSLFCDIADTSTTEDETTKAIALRELLRYAHSKNNAMPYIQVFNSLTRAAEDKNLVAILNFILSTLPLPRTMEVVALQEVALNHVAALVSHSEFELIMHYINNHEKEAAHGSNFSVGMYHSSPLVQDEPCNTISQYSYTFSPLILSPDLVLYVTLKRINGVTTIDQIYKDETLLALKRSLF